MKTVDTLVLDIYELVSSKSSVLDTRELGTLMAEAVERRLTTKHEGSYLRPSNLGKLCARQLWYEVNTPTLGLALPPSAEIKFLFGDLLEVLLLHLATAAGHTVTGRQDECTMLGVTGHRDAVIDGVLVDAKSASTYSFNKFASHLTPDQDSFGYLTQIEFYREASKDDPLVTDPSRSAFLVIDKTLGKICLDIHPARKVDWETLIETKRLAVTGPTPPPRAFHPEPKGKSGNMGLGVTCSYCPFRQQCFPHLRTFLYSTGPEYLTTVARTPNVPEIEE